MGLYALFARRERWESHTGIIGNTFYPEVFDYFFLVVGNMVLAGSLMAVVLVP